MENRHIVHQLLEQILGSNRVMRDGELVFYCPFCNHHKQKFQVNLDNQHWHCWVCDKGGRKLGILFYKLNVDKNTIKELNRLLGTIKTTFTEKNENVTVSLPKEYIPLYVSSNSLTRKHAIAYCRKRNISKIDILRYNIGYCNDGIYANRLIVPSYDINGILNYFVGRDLFANSKLKYKNPMVSRNICMFETLVSFNNPIVLVEGVMDAIAVRRNAIPMLGKFPSKRLMTKILTNKPKVYVALDSDASNDANKLTMLLQNNGIEVTKLNFEEGEDPSSIGYKQFWKKTKQKTTLFSDLMRERLYAN